MRRFCVAIILDGDKNMLMGQRRDSGKFTNPAGGANDGEDPYCCIAREIKEETGLDMKEAQLVHAGTNQRGNLIYTFLCRCSGQIDTTQDPDQECETWTWEDPFRRLSELHVPAEHNHALHWYGTNYDSLKA